MRAHGMTLMVQDLTNPMLAQKLGNTLDSLNATALQVSAGLISGILWAIDNPHHLTMWSDGAFEEQRGSDWAPRWWRADAGLWDRS